MKKILFVCTGNVFRSFCAELCFNDYAKKNRLPWRAVSAGTFEKTQNYVDPALKKALNSFGIAVNGHTPRKVSKKLLADADAIAAIADYHKEFLKEKFDVTVPLYNEMIGKKGSIPDIEDVIKDHQNKRREVEKHLEKIAGYIHDTIPELAKNL